MTLCRKCGKEIPDGEELCEECKLIQEESNEDYLDELIHSMEAEMAESQEPVTEDIQEDLSLDDVQMDEISEELLQGALDEFAQEKSIDEETIDSSMEEPVEEEVDFSVEEPIEEVDPSMEELTEEVISSIEEPVEEEVDSLMEEPIEESIEEQTDKSVEEFLEESSEEPMEEPMEEPIDNFMEDMPPEGEVAATEDLAEEEYIDELLSILSQDFEDYDDEENAGEAALEAAPLDVPIEQPDDSPAEASLFVEDDEDSLFAEDIDAVSVNDIFDDALSAVDYSESEDDDQEDDTEEFISPDSEEISEGFDDLSLDSLGLEETAETSVETASIADPLASEKKTKNSFWKRIFGNIITEQTAEEEAKEREEERAAAEQKAQVREEKKQQLDAEKAEKAEQVQADKEKKAAEKAEKAAVKEAKKEEKKRLKAEMEANEVVGKINPAGASIVMVFFGILCVLVILGTQSLSYTSSVRNAESSLKERKYRDAYESLAGVDVSEATQETKDKIRICMQLQRGLDGFENYYEMKMYLESLDSLMKGIRSYDDNKEKAEEYDILPQYNELEAKLAKQLYDEFGVSESQARSINGTETQEEYTSRLQNIIAQWELRNKEDEK